MVLGEILPDQAVDVLIEAAVPNGMEMGKEKGDVSLGGDAFVIGKCLPVI